MNVAAAAPAAVLALVASAVAPRRLTCLMAAAAVAVAALRPASNLSPAALQVWSLVGALALGLAASAFEQGVKTFISASRVRAAGTAAVAGAVFVLTLIAVDGGRILRWRFGLGAGATRLELPGAALVLGLALLVTLAGTLATAAHLLARAQEGFRAGRIGQSLLVLGGGLGILGIALVVVQGLSRSPDALAAGAGALAAMILAAGVLALALVRLLVPPAMEAVAEAAPSSPRLLRLAAAAAMLAAATAGAEGWRAEGTYATATLAATASAALLGLVAVQPTRLALARTALFVLGLLAALARVV